ncbi:hypothetical protein JB92DRAFT_2824886 [Gautieria morchelliformis]|nr:hypothetical protein JB92DRAFT_2824886 [Gautieria morchelliformis]
MRFSTSILSILAVVGVVCAQGPPPEPPVLLVVYGSDSVKFKAGACIPIRDPVTGVPATSAIGLETVTCQLSVYVSLPDLACPDAYSYFTAPTRDTNCETPIPDGDVVIPKGVTLPKA